jgi:Zn-dependent protease
MSFLPVIELDTLIYRLIALIIAITLHGVVQAAVARSLGSGKAVREGRLSLNPLTHIDPLGLAMVVFGPYGWGRPVHVLAARRRWSISPGRSCT